MTTKILMGDALEQLKGLPDESVQCCVTSPPYYGLRDYGTASWEGGDPGCDHAKVTNTVKAVATSTLEGGKKTTGHLQEGYKTHCPKCGALRKDTGIGLEPTPEAHIARLVEVFGEVKRVLRKDGVLWLNYGDAYASAPPGNKTLGVSDKSTLHGVNGLSQKYRETLANSVAQKRSSLGHGAKPKDLLMLPARVALALQADGWWLRSMMPWVKRSAMPESATDRPATAIEYVFLLTKSARYFYDAEAMRVAAEQPWRSTGRIEGLASRDSGESMARECLRHGGKPREYNPAGRNFRNSDLFYSSLQEPYGLISDAEGAPLALDVNPAGFAESHFATFPVKLIEPLIKAATSEKGCCPACAAPWVREVSDPTGGKIGAAWGPHDNDLVAGNQGGKFGQKAWDSYTPSKTLGWSPSCDCENSFTTVADDPVPCVVLDPFGGAGTTGLVADRLGRDCILIELNPNYAEMARKRISGDAPLFAEVQL